ncbi:uncharacterized protein LOC121183413 isoform X2 [Toxotes jaculatrix]|uniref:uncharacterized protein LOC121183413 isoform X2 n=1 Tax=Toxotes jaculatrix TaxID=941984 RepID=UPI001B3AAAA7|nr:uncharacterized protein LOC121183413 isoform X2 [Toxotes jaculatrix]
MSPVACLRLFVLWFWLLACDVNCENPHRVGYVQEGHSPVGVHNDNRNYERWSEPPIFRISKAGYKTSNVNTGQSGKIYPAQEDHTTDPKSSQIQSPLPYAVIPERQNSNVPKSKVTHFESGFNTGSVTQEQSADTFPDGERIHQASSDSVVSSGPVQFPLRIYRDRTKSKGGLSTVQVDKAPRGFGPNKRKGLIYSQSNTASPNIPATKSSLKSESNKIHSGPNIRPLYLQKSHLTTWPEVSRYHSAHIFHNRKKSFPKVLKPIDKRTDSMVKGHSPGRNLAGKVNRQMPYPVWSPRAYDSDVMSEAKGYAHVRHLKPGFDKTRPQCSLACRKFLETCFPYVNQNQGSYSHDLTELGCGLGVQTSSERKLNHNYKPGNQPSSWHRLPPDRAHIPVQGKFKPFQRLPTNNNLSAHTNSSDNKTAPTQTFAGSTLPPSLNSTGMNSTTVPSVPGDLSTKPPSSMQTRDQADLSQASKPEGQSGGAAEDRPSLNLNNSSPGSFK